MGRYKIQKSEHQTIINRHVLNKEQPLSIAKDYNVTSESIVNILKKYDSYTFVRIRKHSFDEDFFEKIDTEEKAYFLGLLYADGYNNEKDGSIILCLKDVDILDKFKFAIKYSGNIKTISKTCNGKVFRYGQIDLNSRKFSDSCRENGFTQNKSLVLKFPKQDQVPDYLIHHFIRGYFDGDGSISFDPIKRKTASVNILSSESFSLSLKNFLEKELNINIYSYYHKNNKSVYLSISGNLKVNTFLSYIYKDALIYMDRKYSIVNNFFLNRKQISNGNQHSEYLGIQKTSSGKWRANGYNTDERKPVYLGTFELEEQAARAYDKHCIDNKYNYHRLNFDYPEITDRNFWFKFRTKNREYTANA